MKIEKVEKEQKTTNLGHILINILKNRNTIRYMFIVYNKDNNNK